MKKKIYSLFLVFCVIFASSFVLISCGKKHNKAEDWSSDNENHWKACLDKDCDKVFDLEEHDFTESRVEATIDADGKITKTCSVCEKVVEEVIPKIQQTKNEKIDILIEALKAENYMGDIQEEYVSRTNTENYYTALASDLISRKGINKSGELAVRFDAEGTFDENIITAGEFLYLDGEDYISYRFKQNNDKTDFVTDGNTVVGNNYANRYIASEILSNMGYLLEIKNEATAISVLKNALSENVEDFKSMFASLGDEFTFDANDIQVNFDIVYENGKYTAQGTAELNKLNHTSSNPTKRAESFKIEFTIIYTSELVERNYSKFSYMIEESPENKKANLTEIYFENDYRYIAGGEVDVQSIVEIIEIYEGLTYEEPLTRIEKVRFNLGGAVYLSKDVDFGSRINAQIDSFVQKYSTDESVEISKIKVYLDSEHKTEYNPSTDVFVEDFYGTDIYIVILP